MHAGGGEWPRPEWGLNRHPLRCYSVAVPQFPRDKCPATEVDRTPFRSARCLDNLDSRESRRALSLHDCTAELHAASTRVIMPHAQPPVAATLPKRVVTLITLWGGRWSAVAWGVFISMTSVLPVEAIDAWSLSGSKCGSKLGLHTSRLPDAQTHIHH